MASMMSNTSRAFAFVLDVIEPLKEEISMFFVAVLLYMASTAIVRVPKLSSKTRKEKVVDTPPPSRPPSPRLPQQQGLSYTETMKMYKSQGKNNLTKSQSLCANASRKDDYEDLDAIRRQMSRRIQDCGRVKDVQGALQAFKELQERDLLNIFIYNNLLNACIQCDAIDRALALFKKMQTTSTFDVISYNTMIKGLLKVGDLLAVRKLMKEMQEAGLVANTITYLEVLKFMVKTGDRQSAWILVDEMLSLKIGADELICTTLLQAGDGKLTFKEVTRILGLLDSSGRSMDEAMLIAFIGVCVKSESVSLHNLLLNRVLQLTKKGSPLTNIPSSVWVSMFKVCGESADLKKIWSLWELMISHGVKPTAVSVGSMVHILVTKGQTEKAWKLVNSLWEDPKTAESDCVSRITCYIIVKGFHAAKRFDQVIRVVEEMQKRKMYVDTITYNTLLNGLAEEGAITQVQRILKTMLSCTPQVIPDMITYSTIVKCYIKAGDVGPALELYKDMKKMGVTLDERLYNILLDGCGRLNRLDDALHIWEDMKASGTVPSNFTMSILIKVLGRRASGWEERVSEVFNLVDSVTADYGLVTNIQVQTCLLQVCLMCRQPHRAAELHDKLVRDGVVMPDRKFYSVMAKGFMLAKDIDRVLELVRCAYHLEGHMMQVTKGSPPGLEEEMLDWFHRLHHPEAKKLQKELRSVAQTQVQTRRFRA